MTTAERERVIDFLESTRTALLRTIEAFPEEQFETAPAEGCWSAAQTLEHIVFVEGRALGRVRMALTEPAAADRKSAMDGRDEELFGNVRSRLRRVDAPPVLHPVGGQSREQLVSAFEAARDATLRFAGETEADLRFHFAVHPLFGELDCYQWLMLIPSHGERHRLQIEECLAGVTGKA